MTDSARATGLLARVAGSPPLLALAALVAGLVLALSAAASGHPLAARAVGLIEPVGTLWVNAVRMTVLPLIVASLVVAVSDAAPPTVGRLGTRAVVVFVLLMIVLSALSALLVPAVFAHLSIDPVAAGAIRRSAAPAEPAELPSFANWVLSLVPVNPVKAASDGAMLPLVVFTLLFGLAVGRVPGEDRTPVVGFFRGVRGATTVLIRWVLALFSSVPLRRFARAALPAQLVAATTRSSTAPLPLLYNIPLGAAVVASLAVTSILMSFSVPGIPSGGLFVIAPFLATAGLPVEVIGVLIALDLVPDVFKSLANVTGHLAAVTLLARGERVAVPAVAALPDVTARDVI